MKAQSALIVDDDRHILEVLGMRLESMGFDVATTSDPLTGLSVLEERTFDVALVDLRMDPIDGIEFTKAAHARQPRLPVLIMTAHGTIENAVRAVKEGAFDYLTKPFVPDELRGKIARALAERQWAKNRELLARVGQTLASWGAPDRVLEVVARAAMDAAETERAVVFLREGDDLVAKASAGSSPVPLDGLVAVAASAMVDGAPLKVTRDGQGVTLAAPLLVDNVARGALVIENPRYVAPTDEDLAQLAVFAAQAAVAIKNSQELARCRSGALIALGRVATQVAHELNNPLGGLKLFVHLLRERLEKATDEGGVELSHKADRAIDRLSALVKDIMAHGSAPALQREPTRLTTLMEECLSLTEDRILEKQIRVIRALDDTMGEMLLDARELQKVLLNLIVNGVDAMEPGGTLTVATRRLDAGNVEIVIADTGCGMDDETRERMFDLFFTTKQSGTGLGMGIVRSVIERHGGRLEVESRPGEGTRMRVELPTESPER